MVEKSSPTLIEVETSENILERKQPTMKRNGALYELLEQIEYSFEFDYEIKKIIVNPEVFKDFIYEETLFGYEYLVDPRVQTFEVLIEISKNRKLF